METQILISNFVPDLIKALGQANVQTEDESNIVLPASWTARPVAVVLPHYATEVAEVVRLVEQAGASLLTCGGGTQIQTGYPPRADRPYIVLATTRMNRILDYQPEDMTVTCEPGVTLATLQQTLMPRRQCLALDVPLPERATLGGIVAANAGGFDRPAYGSPRDLVIGLRAVMAQGVEIKGGGKVVKNVAGYDVCKLFTGAWGTLGVITELSFKVRTLPELNTMIAWDAPDLATAARVGLKLHHARLAGTSFLATNEIDNEIDSTPRLVVGLQGSRSRTDWQAAEYDRLVREAGLHSASALSPRFYSLTPEQVDAWRDRQARLTSPTPLAGRIACLPTEVADLLARLSVIPSLEITAHCATGIVSFAVRELDGFPVAQIQERLPKGANLVWVRVDAAVPKNEALDIWGQPRDEAGLQRALKRTLDPDDIFSPGRFIQRL